MSSSVNRRLIFRHIPRCIMNGLSSSNILGVPWLWLSKVRKTQVTYLILDISEKAGAINSNQKLFGEEGFAEEGSDDLKYL